MALYPSRLEESTHLSLSLCSAVGTYASVRYPCDFLVSRYHRFRPCRCSHGLRLLWCVSIVTDAKIPDNWTFLVHVYQAVLQVEPCLLHYSCFTLAPTHIHTARFKHFQGSHTPSYFDNKPSRQSWGAPFAVELGGVGNLWVGVRDLSAVLSNKGGKAGPLSTLTCRALRT